MAVAKAYKDDGPIGLMFLFINPKFINKFMLNSTQEVLNMKEASQGTLIRLTVAKIRCVIGLDIAMSLCNTTTMKELWITKMFLGSTSFRECMSRNEFLTIRGSLCIHNKSSPKNHNNPLWSCRPLFSQVFGNLAAVAYPIGVASLDEATCPSKSRNRAQTYLPNKPDKFGFCFYLLNGWHYVYTYVIWDNGSGNTCPTSPADHFLSMLGELMSAFNNFVSSFKSKICKACLIDPKSASMMWDLMFGLLYRQIHLRRPIVSDCEARQVEQDSGSNDGSDDNNVDEENENEEEEEEKDEERLEEESSEGSDSKKEAQQDEGENKNNATTPTSLQNSSNAPDSSSSVPNALSRPPPQIQDIPLVMQHRCSRTML